jgi:hypothetical protein
MAQPKGVTLFNLLAIWGALGTFLGLWISLYVPIWRAGDGPAPHLSSTAVYAASVLGGVLAAFFSTALGVQRKDPTVDARALRPGATLLRTDAANPPGIAAFATTAFWVYAVVGAWSMVTVLFHQVQSPHDVKAMASAFAGVVLTLFTGALAPGQTSQ